MHLWFTETQIMKNIFFQHGYNKERPYELIKDFYNLKTQLFQLIY